MRGTCLAVLLLGCSFKQGVGGGPALPDGSIEDIDAPPADARVDAPPGSVCFGTALFVDCYPAAQVPTGTYAPSGAIDTSDPQSCTRIVAQPGGSELCLRAAGTVTIASTVRYTGSRPLVLLAAQTLVVATGGTLDVSSSRNAVGAGGDANDCAAAAVGANDTSNAAVAGAGGGGGGGFGTSGGSGGAGKAVTGGAGGGTTALAEIRGGCRGARGGTSSVGPGGEGGHGGGAVYLVAGESIKIDGTVKASGAGGNGGPNKAGGGGGGSGGMIAFDAPAVSVTGTLCANGGGGGEGGGGGRSGDHGAEPDSFDQRASGGSTNDQGGDGGPGSVFASAGLVGGIDSNGGGGGGGGAGRIKFYQSAAATGNVSPPAN